ncbi:hypothetical protein SKAU_G00287900 [Synaphobranchus kaupii]|uniref:BTB domain-containing protein n=1 Tax=Synaphobranchus kaupii TaxID=118154 RepID=A0A9Q1EYD2_SYNKA|nr:hypothetical protein SKAU_G00287900 [Synaphobranchus kaupii]
MFAVHGSGQRAKLTATSREASAPASESSLSWCLTQLSKAGNAAGAQMDGGGQLDHGEKAKEADRRARAGLWRALVAIRTRHIKGGSAGIARYRARGGLKPLLEVLRHPGCHRKTQDLVLSILANCCTERETRAEVRKLGGIGHVVAVLKNVPVETVQNRAARALGNLAIDPENSNLIHSAASPCPKLDCAQSAARALLYLSDTPANRLSLLSQGALPALTLLIAPEYPSGLRRASLRALNELTKGCSVECAKDVSRSGALAQLGVLAQDESGPPLGEAALKTLANLCTQGCLRPLVGSLGVIQKFVEEIKKSPSKSGLFFKALCLCCKEAVNRVKVKESGGLEVLIGFLSANQSHPLSRLAVLAFVDFVYDESALEQLQGLGLVPLLVSRLVDLAKGEEMAVGEVDTPVNSSSSELMDTSCFDSFDFPTLEGHRREEGGKEQAQGSSSFLSLRSWLLSEGLISCEGELLSPSGSGDGNWNSLCPSFSPPAPLSDGLSPLTCPSPTLAVPLHSSTPVTHTNVAPVPPSTLILPSSYHKRVAVSVSSPPPPPSTPPPHKPMSSPPSQPSSPPKKQPQTRSSTPSNALPPETPPGPSYHHPYHPEPWTSESPILLLLSRFSQSMDPSAALVHSGILPGLLYYLTQREDPSARCFRMLGRLSCNPNCLQGLVRTGAAALIRLRLCLREGLREGDRQTDRVKASTWQLGKTLLNNLRLQCESSFGSGVLTHIMLSGSDTDRLYCTLSIPLVTSNKLLQKKLLLDSGGLQSALEYIGWHDDSKDHTIGCWKSLASWLHPPQPATPARLRSLYFSLLTECLSCLIGQPKLEPDKSACLGSVTGVGMLANNVSIPLISESHLPPPFKKPRLSHPCPYLDSDFDVIFLLDDGSRFAASEGAVAGGDGSERVGSEYFRALLKGGFGEAQTSRGEGIRIRDVTAKMFLPVLHYLHGCWVSPRERESDKELGTIGKIEGEKGPGGNRTSGPCMVLGSLAMGGLGKCRKRGEGEMSSLEGEGFQNTPLAEALAGASRFLVSGLQEELEAVCMTQLQYLTAPRPMSATSVTRRSSEDTERRLISKADCRYQANKTESVGKSGPEPMCKRGSGKDLSSESDSEFEVPVESRKQAVGSGVPQGCSANLMGQTQSSSELVTMKASDEGRRKPNTQQNSKPGLEPRLGSRRTSALDRKIERLSQATTKSCCVSDCSPDAKLGSALRKDDASNLEADSYNPSPTSEPDSPSSTRSDQDSGSQARQNLKAAGLSDLKLAKPSGPKLDLSSRLENAPDTELGSPAAQSLTPSPMSDMDCEERSLVVTLPELYCFCQLHNYPRLGQMCLSVLLWQQKTSPQLPTPVAADCMSKLARSSHCIETLKQDLLLLVTRALN